MIKQLIVGILLWWAIIIGIIVTIDIAYGQNSAAPEGIASCQDVLTIANQSWVEGGWTFDKSQQMEPSGAIYTWVKGKAVRGLLFAPEAAGSPPKDSIFKLMGRCEYKGEIRVVYRGLLEGEKA